MPKRKVAPSKAIQSGPRDDSSSMCSHSDNIMPPHMINQSNAPGVNGRPQHPGPQARMGPEGAMYNPQGGYWQPTGPSTHPSYYQPPPHHLTSQHMPPAPTSSRHHLQQHPQQPQRRYSEVPPSHLQGPPPHPLSSTRDYYERTEYPPPADQVAIVYSGNGCAPMPPEYALQQGQAKISQYPYPNSSKFSTPNQPPPKYANMGMTSQRLPVIQPSPNTQSMGPIGSASSGGMSGTPPSQGPPQPMVGQHMGGAHQGMQLQNPPPHMKHQQGMHTLLPQHMGMPQEIQPQPQHSQQSLPAHTPTQGQGPTQGKPEPQQNYVPIMHKSCPLPPSVPKQKQGVSSQEGPSGHSQIYSNVPNTMHPYAQPHGSPVLSSHSTHNQPRLSPVPSTRSMTQLPKAPSHAGSVTSYGPPQHMEGVPQGQNMHASWSGSGGHISSAPSSQPPMVGGQTGRSGYQNSLGVQQQQQMLPPGGSYYYSSHMPPSQPPPQAPPGGGYYSQRQMMGPGPGSTNATMDKCTCPHTYGEKTEGTASGEPADTVVMYTPRGENMRGQEVQSQHSMGMNNDSGSGQGPPRLATPPSQGNLPSGGSSAIAGPPLGHYPQYTQKPVSGPQGLPSGQPPQGQHNSSGAATLPPHSSGAPVQHQQTTQQGPPARPHPMAQGPDGVQQMGGAYLPPPPIHVPAPFSQSGQAPQQPRPQGPTASQPQPFYGSTSMQPPHPLSMSHQGPPPLDSMGRPIGGPPAQPQAQPQMTPQGMYGPGSQYSSLPQYQPRYSPYPQQQQPPNAVPYGPSHIPSEHGGRSYGAVAASTQSTPSVHSMHPPHGLHPGMGSFEVTPASYAPSQPIPADDKNGIQENSRGPYKPAIIANRQLKSEPRSPVKPIPASDVKQENGTIDIKPTIPIPIHPQPKSEPVTKKRKKDKTNMKHVPPAHTSTCSSSNRLDNFLQQLQLLPPVFTPDGVATAAAQPQPVYPDAGLFFEQLVVTDSNLVYPNDINEDASINSKSQLEPSEDQHGAHARSESQLEIEDDEEGEGEVYEASGPRAKRKRQKTSEKEKDSKVERVGKDGKGKGKEKQETSSDNEVKEEGGQKGYKMVREEDVNSDDMPLASPLIPNNKKSNNSRSKSPKPSKSPQPTSGSSKRRRTTTTIASTNHTKEKDKSIATTSHTSTNSNMVALNRGETLHKTKNRNVPPSPKLSPRLARSRSPKPPMLRLSAAAERDKDRERDLHKRKKGRPPGSVTTPHALPITKSDIVVGFKVDAKDPQDSIYHAARIRRMEKFSPEYMEMARKSSIGSKTKDVQSLWVQVHFEGWGSEYDEWMQIKNLRCRSDDCWLGPLGPDSEEKWEKIKAFSEEEASYTSHTGVVYDAATLIHRCTCGNQDLNHPERPQRIVGILQLMDDNKLLDRVMAVRGREVTRKELLAVHEEEHVVMYGGKELGATEPPPNLEVIACGGTGIAYDTICNEDSPVSARVSSGCLVELTAAVVKGTVNNGFAIIRPPGHHAEHAQAGGFCFFNNVGVAARAAQQTMGVGKVAIIDWDVHHGNGTQNIFYDDPSVLYMSLHRHDDGGFYPYTGDATECGEGAGVGFTVNIPWRESGDKPPGNTEYVSAFHHFILPITREFNPDLVFVSAGFDAADGDELGGCKVTPEGFAHMTQLLLELAGGKVILSLEGGYHVSSLSASAVACIKVILGEPAPPLSHTSATCFSLSLNHRPHHPQPNAVGVFQKVAKIQSQHWKCMELLRQRAEVTIDNEDDSKEHSDDDAHMALTHKSANHDTAPVAGSVTNMSKRSSTSNASQPDLKEDLKHPLFEPEQSTNHTPVANSPDPTGHTDSGRTSATTTTVTYTGATVEEMEQNNVDKEEVATSSEVKISMAVAQEQIAINIEENMDKIDKDQDGLLQEIECQAPPKLVVTGGVPPSLSPIPKPSVTRLSGPATGFNDANVIKNDESSSLLVDLSRPGINSDTATAFAVTTAVNNLAQVSSDVTAAIAKVLQTVTSTMNPLLESEKEIKREPVVLDQETLPPTNEVKEMIKMTNDVAVITTESSNMTLTNTLMGATVSSPKSANELTEGPQIIASNATTLTPQNSGNLSTNQTVVPSAVEKEVPPSVQTEPIIETTHATTTTPLPPALASTPASIAVPVVAVKQSDSTEIINIASVQAVSDTVPVASMVPTGPIAAPAEVVGSSTSTTSSEPNATLTVVDEGISTSHPNEIEETNKVVEVPTDTTKHKIITGTWDGDNDAPAPMYSNVMEKIVDGFVVVSSDTASFTETKPVATDKSITVPPLLEEGKKKRNLILPHGETAILALRKQVKNDIDKSSEESTASTALLKNTSHGTAAVAICISEDCSNSNTPVHGHTAHGGKRKKENGSKPFDFAIPLNLFEGGRTSRRTSPRTASSPSRKGGHF